MWRFPGWSLTASTCPQVPLVIKALQRQLKDRNIRARQGCFSLLTELAGVLPGSLAEHMPVLVAGRMDWNLVSAVLGLFQSSRVSLFSELWWLSIASSENKARVQALHPGFRWVSGLVSLSPGPGQALTS